MDAFVSDFEVGVEVFEAGLCDRIHIGNQQTAVLSARADVFEVDGEIGEAVHGVRVFVCDAPASGQTSVKSLSHHNDLFGDQAAYL